MPDSADIDQALIMKLNSDTTLLSYAKAGVYWDEAPPINPNNPDTSKFVIVSLVDESDAQHFSERAFEDTLYMVKYVERSVSAANAKAAAARIDALLDGGTLTIPGYGFMAMHRESRIRITEVDDVDTSIRWQHRGGQYRVVASPT